MVNSRLVATDFDPFLPQLDTRISSSSLPGTRNHSSFEEEDEQQVEVSIHLLPLLSNTTEVVERKKDEEPDSPHTHALATGVMMLRKGRKG